MLTSIHFLLNDREVSATAPRGQLVLDYLRGCANLVGTKEGCKEGDCGACMVLIGELQGDAIDYKPVTSCLVPIGELHGKHVVTVEGLNMAELSPVQQAIVDQGGSQCGFCTPGIVLSLTGYLMQPGATIDADGVKYALGGNLCRCTGYSSLKNAGRELVNRFGNGSKFSAQTDADGVIRRLVEAAVLPKYFDSIPKRLRKIPKPELERVQTGNEYFIAGGTDIYVQSGELLPASKVEVLNLHPEMKGITRCNGSLRLGALTTFEEFADSPEVRHVIPDIKQYMHLNASWQIRNRATLGGNIVNASPIGDMTILLLALNADLVLSDSKKRRTVSIKSFFRGYKDLAKEPDEVLTEIILPVPIPDSKVHFEKVSKRKTLDIASVNSAIRIRTDEGTIEEMDLSMGGVAPIPLHLSQTCEYLEHQCIAKDTILEAIQTALGEISPISDIRGSREYKRLLVRQLVIAHFTKLFPEYVNVSDFYETR